jgi:hypothetical protein
MGGPAIVRREYANHSMKLVVTGDAGFIGANVIRYRMRRHPSHAVVNCWSWCLLGRPPGPRV